MLLFIAHSPHQPSTSRLISDDVISVESDPEACVGCSGVRLGQVTSPPPSPTEQTHPGHRGSHEGVVSSRRRRAKAYGRLYEWCVLVMNPGADSDIEESCRLQPIGAKASTSRDLDDDPDDENQLHQARVHRSREVRGGSTGELNSWTATICEKDHGKLHGGRQA